MHIFANKDLSSKNIIAVSLNFQMQGISQRRYASYCKLTSLRIIGLDVGSGRFMNIRNIYSFTGLVLRSYDVRFLTEQNGFGNIYARFNGQRVSCSGLAQSRFKTCTVSRRLHPWSGRFTVEVLGKSHPSAGFSMAGKPGK